MEIYPTGMSHSVVSITAILLALSACSSPPPIEKHVHVQKPVQPVSYTANEFVQHLSLSELQLTDTVPDMAAAGPDLAVIETYTSPLKKTKKPTKDIQTKETVIILECKASGNGTMQKVAAPFSHNYTQAAQELINQMNDRKCTFYNIHPASVVVSRGDPISFKDDSAAQALEKITARLNPMLAAATPLPQLDEARIEITLTKLCADANQRDAAYISDDNAKRALAAAEELPENEAAVVYLSKQLEDIETQMHKTMPFTL